MTGQQLRNSILQEAIHGRLVPNVLQPGEKTGEELLKDILVERQKKENEEKGKKARRLTLSSIEEEPWAVPEGWCWCKLPEMCEIRFGTRVVKKYDEGSTFFVYGGGGATFKVDSYNRENALLVSRFAMSKQCTRFVAGKFFLNDSGLSLHTYGISVQQSFLNYLIFAFNDTIYQLGRGAAQKNLNMDEFEELLLPLPPQSIQKAIVEKIEELLPLIDEYDKASVELENLNKILPDKLRKSVLQEAIHGTLVPNDIPEGEATAQELLQTILKERQERENKEKGKKAKKLALSTIDEEPWELPDGWCWCKLSDLFNIVSARRVHQSDWRTSGIPFYRTREIGWLSENRTDVKPELYIDESLYQRFKESGYPTAGDIMMTAVGTVGKTYIVQKNDKFYYKDASVLCLENFSNVDSKYICFLIASPFFKSMIGEEAMGTTVATITMVRANEYLVPLPPLSIQRRIVEKIEEVFAAIDRLQ